MLARLIPLVLLAITLIEIALFIVVGQAIGLWPTLLLVVFGIVFGSLIIRHQGLRLLLEARDAMGQGRLPARALADAMLVSVGGALLVVPGFFTDFLGLLLLAPPVRSAIYRFLGRRLGIGHPPARRDGGPEAPSGPRTIELDDEHFRPR